VGLKIGKSMKSDFKSYLDISLSFQTLPPDEVFPLLLKRRLFKRNSTADSVFMIPKTTPPIRFLIQVDANPESLLSQYLLSAYLPPGKIYPNILTNTYITALFTETSML